MKAPSKDTPAAALPPLAVTLPDAAAALSLGISQIRVMVRSGELPVAYFGRCPRVLWSDLQRITEERAAQRQEALRAEQDIARYQQEMVPLSIRSASRRRRRAQ